MLYLRNQEFEMLILLTALRACLSRAQPVGCEVCLLSLAALINCFQFVSVLQKPHPTVHPC